MAGPMTTPATGVATATTFIELPSASVAPGLQQQ